MTVDARPGVWSADVDIATLISPHLLHQRVYTTVYELRRGFMTLANINCCVASRARGRVGSYQLSVFGFQIVTVFGRIRIVHLAHYSVRFEFESNIRYRPSNVTFAVFSISKQVNLRRICRAHLFAPDLGEKPRVVVRHIIVIYLTVLDPCCPR